MDFFRTRRIIAEGNSIRYSGSDLFPMMMSWHPKPINRTGQDFPLGFPFLVEPGNYFKACSAVQYIRSTGIFHRKLCRAECNQSAQSQHIGHDQSNSNTSNRTLPLTSTFDCEAAMFGGIGIDASDFRTALLTPPRTVFRNSEDRALSSPPAPQDSSTSHAAGTKKRTCAVESGQESAARPSKRAQTVEKNLPPPDPQSAPSYADRLMTGVAYSQRASAFAPIAGSTRQDPARCAVASTAGGAVASGPAQAAPSSRSAAISIARLLS
jgi:hypothetical protein